jgi:putative tryptophan/tyrosine transport system substrate-binding protein
MPDSFMQVHQGTVISLTARNNVPAVGADLPGFAKEGGLLSYGASFPDIFRRAASYVDRILRGANPGDLPVQAPTKWELVINLKTAKALGLDVPPTLLATADEIIE